MVTPAFFCKPGATTKAYLLCYFYHADDELRVFGRRLLFRPVVIFCPKVLRSSYRLGVEPKSGNILRFRWDSVEIAPHLSHVPERQI